MKIFISGASGLLGGNCLKHFAEQGATVVGSHLSFATDNTVYFDTLTPLDPENFDVAAFQPDVIVHCGALTHVDYCEDHVEESYQKTVQSTINLVQLAKQCHAQFVFISTDYVFDGLEGPYSEDASVNPLSIYGKHKWEAEEAVRAVLPQSLILRVTNVYGDEIRGKNFVARILQQCKEGATLHLKLPFDQYASPTNAWDIARAMYLLLKDHHQGVFHIGSTDYMNRVELALKVISYYPNAQYHLQPISTESMQQPAPRPLLGGFIHKKFSSFYPDFLFHTVDNYMQQHV
jgi:dTDP-4-dehydrorhamnose reductase